ncbi:MAG: AAA family ATPase [Candidatus Latescibacteria bacterium]|nr:AAA family ATPase [Candidatus Latescibacterota bacterium]
MSRNPYLNRSMIRAVEQFYGRQREIERLMARLGSQAPQSVSLVGQRRVGKSSLLWHIAQPEIHARYLENPDTYVFVLLDLQGQQHLDQAGFCRVWGRQLKKAVGGRLEVGAIGDFAAVEELVARLDETGLRLVCLLDEFEAVTGNPAFGPEFFGFLRALANKYPISFVTASRAELRGLCRDRAIAESPFFNIFSRVQLGPLDEAAVRKLIAEPSAAAGVPLEEHRDEILALGGHLPFFVQMACAELFEAAQAGQPQQAERYFAQEAANHFDYLWEHFNEDQRQLVGLLAGGASVAPEQVHLLQDMLADGYILEEGAGVRLFSTAFVSFLQRHQLIAAVEAAPLQRPRPEEGATVAPLPPDRDPFPHIIGHSEPMRRVYALMERAAATDATVLLLGETGTGKELLAQTIHQHSQRCDGPFVAVNCGAIAEQLQDSELFGHKKGAFTDAAMDRAGLFEAADGGTLFLDEIGETAPGTQVKLLRALQEGEIRRLGDDRPRRVDVRLICATNRRLEDEVAQGRFRADLYYRLYVLVLTLPPLRQRRSDIPLLVEHFLAGRDIDDQALDYLPSYTWPGNIRELENQLISAAALAGDAPIGVDHLWPRLRQAPTLQAADENLVGQDLDLREARERFERVFIQDKLERNNRDLEATSQALGLSRSRLYALLNRYGLKAE